MKSQAESEPGKIKEHDQKESIKKQILKLEAEIHQKRLEELEKFD